MTDRGELPSAKVHRLFESAGQPLKPDQGEALAAYLKLLMRWSKRMSLTGHRDPAVAAEKLLIDGVEVAPLLPRRAATIDVGAGAGGLSTTVALLRPDVELQLVEPRQKRAAFLRAVRRELGLTNVEVVEGRAESLPTGQADAVYAQAVFPPPQWMELGRGLLRPGGVLLCLTAEPIDGKVPSGLVVETERRYRLPQSGTPRVVTKLSVG